MVRDHFRVLRVDLADGRGEVITLEGRDRVAGGSGLAALLFEKYGHVDKLWSDPEQPLIFAIGPLTGYFPLMSKTVSAFKSPYHDQYAESHAGGRSALALRFADYDALVFTGKAERLSAVVLGSRRLEMRDVHYMRGLDLQITGKMLRRMFGGAGHRSILRIGPAGEMGSAMACINADTYRQVSYDHEPIFAAGSMLGVTNAFKVLALIDVTEKMGLDVMSAGVALAWATEALEKGFISEKETLAPLRFGEAETYKEALVHLGRGKNDFYRLLGQGALKAAKHYGGEDFACVLGQEMGGYATGEVFFISQALGFRHSHLDAGGYSYDQKHQDKDVEKAVSFLVQDEQERVLLTSMVSCLFAREVYKREVLAECLGSLGYQTLAGELEAVSNRVQKLRWKIRVATGFDPSAVEVPKRFTEVTTWKGKVDGDYLKALKSDYARRIVEMGREERDERR